MKILTYPIGLVIGIITVHVNLGIPPRPAQLLLDGQPACDLAEGHTQCRVDLGREPAVHRLDLVRQNADSEEVERAHRWVNLPGSEAELDLSMACPEPSGWCEAHLFWAHPLKQDPKKLKTSLDGRLLSQSVSHRIRFRLDTQQLHLLTVDAEFPDGRRVSAARALGGGFGGGATANLRAVPLEAPGTLDGLRDRLAAGGVEVQAVEPGPSRVVFVVEPEVIGRFRYASRASTSPERWFRTEAKLRRWLKEPSELSIIIAGAKLLRTDVDPSETGSRWQLLSRAGLFLMKASSRVADAVAVGGMVAASRPGRRAVVLVTDGATDDRSRVSPAAVRRYLSEIMVPLQVWHIGGTNRSAWPGGCDVLHLDDFEPAVAAVKAELDRQALAWVAWEADPHLPRGLRLGGLPIAGRSLTRISHTPSS